MAVSPDSAPAALAALDSITPGMLGGGEEKARYALLKSMALDKNYIDTTDFKVLQPAIDYYLTKDKGTPDDKLRTYYYQGRIYQNQGDDDSAMQSFMRGRDLGSQVKDTLTLANLMVVQGTIYITIYKYDDFIKVNLDAARLYRDIKRTDYEVSSLINAMYGGILNDDKHLADSVMEATHKIVKNDSDLAQAIQPYVLSYITNFGTEGEIEEFLSQFGRMDSISDNDKVEIANAYCNIGNPDKAGVYLESIKPDSKTRHSTKYLATKPYVLEKVGDYKGAFFAYQDYSNTMDSIHLNIFTHDLLFAQQRHELEKSNLLEVQKRNMFIWISLSVILFLLIIIGFFFHHHRISQTRIKLKDEENERLRLEQEVFQRNKENDDLKEKNLRLRINELEREYDSLKEVLAQQKDIEKPIQDFILERIEMLNGLVSTYISDRRVNSKSVELIEDRDKFLESTRKVLKATHPKFMEHLDSFGLTDMEKNYLYLYAIGLQGKEIGNYLNLKRHYHIGVEIRKKLGLSEKDYNLGKYIKILMKEL